VVKGGDAVAQLLQRQCFGGYVERGGVAYRSVLGRDLLLHARVLRHSTGLLALGCVLQPSWQQGCCDLRTAPWHHYCYTERVLGDSTGLLAAGCVLLQFWCDLRNRDIM
jgi:hypothetical protein